MSYRPKKFSSGMMRHRINVQTAVDTVDDAGQTLRGWESTLTAEPADYTPTIGGEVIRGKQVEAGVSAVFTVRYRAGFYDPTKQIVFDGTTYGIVHVKPVDGGRRYIELHCKG